MKIAKKVFFLESLRGIFALMIVLFHFKEVINSIVVDNFIVRNGSIFVDLFFVISGFVIAHNYIDKINSFKNLFKFQFKRFLRLYPLHLTMLIIFSFTEIIKLFFFLKTGVNPNNPIYSTNNLESFIKNILLLQGFLTTNTFNNPSWSISQEFYTYFLFGLLIVLTKGNKKIIYIIFIIISATSYFFIQKYQSQIQTNIYANFRCLFCFFLGACLTIRNERMKIKINFFFSNILNLFLFVVSLICLSNNSYFLTILSFAMFILVNLYSSKNIVHKLLNNKILIFLGSVSYGIYMIHFFIIYAVIQILRFYIYNSQDNLIFKTIKIKDYISNFNGNLLLILIIFVTIFFSYLSKIYLENFFKIIGNKIKLYK
jgi:peptidoglycan/LPS O-acetylase OafA/YrhL